MLFATLFRRIKNKKWEFFALTINNYWTLFNWLKGIYEHFLNNLKRFFGAMVNSARDAPWRWPGWIHPRHIGPVQQGLPTAMTILPKLPKTCFFTELKIYKITVSHSVAGQLCAWSYPENTWHEIQICDWLLVLYMPWT